MVARTAIALLALLASPPAVGTEPSGPPPPPPQWPGEELPLPLAVRTQRDLALKVQAERLYLLFNLLAGGKVAFDRGDLPLATKKWQALLAVPDLPPAIEAVVRSLLGEAQRGDRASVGAPAPPANVAASSSPAAMPSPAPPAPAISRVSVSGRVSGGGDPGPGGAVLWLKRLDGPMPRVRPGRPRVVGQRNKTFVPRVLAVTVGTAVTFRNDDDFFHNVFSLSDPGRFDTGLYQAGGSYTQTFDKPGPVHLLCNIHAGMAGYVYVVDSPYYTQAGGDGAFVIKNVPPGSYELSAWHEASARVVSKRLAVGAQGTTGLSVAMPADRPASAFVPDKYGKPRQPNVGY